MNNIKIKKLYISLTTFCLVLVLSFIVGKKYFYNTSKQFFKIYKESLIGFNYSQSKESILNSNTDWTKQNSTSQTNYWKHKSKFDSDFYKERFINFNNDGFRPSAFLNVKYNNPNYKLGIVAGVLGEGFRFSDSETVPALIKQFAEKNNKIADLELLKGPSDIKNSNFEILNFSISANNLFQQINLATGITDQKRIDQLLIVISGTELMTDFFSLAVQNFKKAKYCVDTDNENFQSLKSENIQKFQQHIENLLKKSIENKVSLSFLYIKSNYCSAPDKDSDFDFMILRYLNTLGFAVCEDRFSDRIKDAIFQQGFSIFNTREMNDFTAASIYRCLDRISLQAFEKKK